MNRIEVLRLDYLFSVILPCLLAIYINHLHIIDYLDIIFGWGFLGITGNLLNDIKDMFESSILFKEGYAKKSQYKGVLWLLRKWKI